MRGQGRVRSRYFLPVFPRPGMAKLIRGADATLFGVVMTSIGRDNAMVETIRTYTNLSRFTGDDV